MMIGILWCYTTLDLTILDTRQDLEGNFLHKSIVELNVLTNKSPNMIPKQSEMDGIVSQIHHAIETTEALESTLLILLGDHGMNDAGNHGGSAPGETSPALVFISPKLKTINSGFQTPAAFEENFQYYSTVEQSDIAPTLGALLGFPVPQNNLGAFIPAFLPFWQHSM